MIYIGIDDTDVIGSPGTNQLARAILRRLGGVARGAVKAAAEAWLKDRYAGPA